MKAFSFAPSLARDACFRPFFVVCLLAVLSCVFPLRAGEPVAKPSSGTPLDATPAEIVKFYGPILRANARVRNHQILDGTVLDGNLYGKNGIVIRVVFYKGRSVLLEYTRATGALTAEDVRLLLAANASNFSWETGKDSTDTTKFYRRSDDKAIAHWTTENDGSLLVSAEDAIGTFAGGAIQ